MSIRCCALLVLFATEAAAQVLAPGAAAALQLSTFVGSGVPSLTDFRFLPGGRMVITLKTGQVLVRRADGTLVQAGAFSGDSSSEKGLLGVEVHPQFGAGATRTLFFYVSASNAAGGTDLDRHRVVAVELGDDDRLAAAQTVLLRGLRGPANHDGGALAIGPDGKLYVGVGDTGWHSALPPPPPPVPPPPPRRRRPSRTSTTTPPPASPPPTARCCASTSTGASLPTIRWWGRWCPPATRPRARRGPTRPTRAARREPRSGRGASATRSAFPSTRRPAACG